MPVLNKTTLEGDVVYTSNTGYTVTVGRYQVTPSPGVRLRDVDPQLEELTRDTEVYSATYRLDNNGSVTGLMRPDGTPWLVVSTLAPNDADGLPNGTIHIQVT